MVASVSPCGSTFCVNWQWCSTQCCRAECGACLCAGFVWPWTIETCPWTQMLLTLHDHAFRLSQLPMVAASSPHRLIDSAAGSNLAFICDDTTVVCRRRRHGWLHVSSGTALGSSMQQWGVLLWFILMASLHLFAFLLNDLADASKN